MYGDIVYHIDEQRVLLAQSSQRAADGWRFRNHKGLASRIVSAAWAGMKQIVFRGPLNGKPAIASARKQLSLLRLM